MRISGLLKKRTYIINREQLMTNNTTVFNKESDLTAKFCDILNSKNSPWKITNFIQEYNYNSGRTDVVCISRRKRIIAFELKIQDWKQALHQAHRNYCFAHQSYVILPEKKAIWALSFKEEFIRRSVGLCYISNDRIQILIKPCHQKPIQPRLTNIAFYEISAYNN